MSTRWSLGDKPSQPCISDRHEECVDEACTCRCHYWTDNGLEPVAV